MASQVAVLSGTPLLVNRRSFAQTAARLPRRSLPSKSGIVAKYDDTDEPWKPKLSKRVSRPKERRSTPDLLSAQAYPSEPGSTSWDEEEDLFVNELSKRVARPKRTMDDQ